MSEQVKTGKLLEVEDLHVSFFTPAGEVKAVGGISYDLNYGEVMGIVGESGSGKSQEAYAIMGLLQSPGKVIGGSITFEGEDMLAKTKEEMIAFRGSKVAMIFQNPMTCLNPVYTIGNQLIEALKAHDKEVSKEEAGKRAMEMLELVGINNVEKRMKQYILSSPAAHRRRAHHRPGRDHPGPDSGAHEGASEKDPYGHYLHHPQPGRGGGNLRQGFRHVRGQDGGAGPGGRYFLPARPPLYRGAAALHAPGGRGEL